MKGTLCQLSYSGKIQNRDIRLYALHPLSVLRLIVPVSLWATVLAHYFKGITPCFAVGALAEQSCSVKVTNGIRTHATRITTLRASCYTIATIKSCRLDSNQHYLLYKRSASPFCHNSINKSIIPQTLSRVNNY